jgi:hypothetical protein
MKTLLRRLLRRPVRAPRVVVAGMPKSGTTAVAMLMGAAAELDVNSDPFHRLDRRDSQFRDELYAGHISLADLVKRYRSHFAGGLIKDPNFVFFVPGLADAFPGAGRVMIVRDPRDNIRSILNRLELPGRTDPSPDQRDRLNRTWQRVLDGHTPDLPGENHVEVLAHRWRVAAANYFDHADSLQLIRYEEFVQDKVAAIEALLSKLGLVASKSIDHMVDRQFQPRGDHTVTWQDFFGPERLDSIERICAREMEALGYAVGRLRP